MASSSSSSSSSSSNKYDVFLSFRGEDTRCNFTSHLHAALCQKQIETFIDNELRRGDKISPSLLNAIKQSKIAVVILSEGYASSRWCLQELVKILKCKNKYKQIVIPVFYRVDPSDVRKQTGNFGNGFSKLEKRFMKRVEKLEKWKNALREVAHVSGFVFDSGDRRSESELVQQIVNDILRRLNDMFPTELDKNFVGMESRIKEIKSLVSYNFIDVHVLGIWGIGGIGKTTFARVIFNKFSYYFDSFCFLKNIREESEKKGGLVQLEQKFLFTLLGDRNSNDCILDLNFARKRICHKKVMIVFDDVTSFQQIKFLIGNFEWLENGSLVIITTRDKQILRNCGVKIEYEMKELKNDNALKLFSRHAFKRDQPNIGYEELSSIVMEYCHGIPLALEILGCSLFEKSKEVWESSIKKLKRIPHDEIQNVLVTSYDALDNVEKNIFLDIACFLKGENKDFAIKFLDACGYYAERGLCNLEDKCLIKVSEHNQLIMHDLLQQMGWEIVRQRSVNDHGKRSRLWDHEEICEVLEDNTGTDAIQAISLDMSKVDKINLNFDVFKKMRNLRFLKFCGDNKLKICDFEGSGYIFRKLRFLHWEGYPLKELPHNIRAENLIFLRLPGSKVEQLWNGDQNLINLKEIDLHYSQHLTKLPDLSKAQNLEKLTLYGCESLHSLPMSIGSKSLKILSLGGCSSLKRIPEILSCNIEELNLSKTTIEELPSFIEYQSRLVTLSLNSCSQLENLPNNLCKLKSLNCLWLSNCKNLRRLPDEIGNLEALVELWISGTSMREVPPSIVCLSNLKYLNLSGLKGHKLNSFISSISSSLVGLSNLSLTNCDISELPESLGQLSSLRYLDLRENNFERIPESIINLSKLEQLNLCYCQRLQSLPKLSCNLKVMTAKNCTSLESLTSLSFCFEFLESGTYDDWKGYDFTNCYKLKGDEVRKLFEESLQKIQLVETSITRVSTCIMSPGSEISEWFKNQSTGSSITLELPRVDHQKLIGFAFCLIVRFEEHHDEKEVFVMRCNLKIKTVDGKWRFSSLDRWFTYGSGAVYSDHIILGYKFSDFEEFSDINEVVIQFYCKEAHTNKNLKGCEWLKKCGIRFLFSQDYGESMTDCNSTDVEEEEDEEEEELNF